MTNRIIKFRAFVEGLATPMYTFDLGAPRFIIDKIDEGAPVMQFTGLLDKNGKEIYEGDITESQGMTGHIFREEVVFWEGCFCHKTSDNRGHIFNPKHEVIIGNIYENPTLLTSHE